MHQCHISFMSQESSVVMNPGSNTRPLGFSFYSCLTGCLNLYVNSIYSVFLSLKLNKLNIIKCSTVPGTYQQMTVKRILIIIIHKIHSHQSTVNLFTPIEVYISKYIST